MIEEQLIHRIQNSINYIEDRLYEKLYINDIAKAAFMSQSAFYVIFSSILGSTVKDYIRKRRLSLSAYDLIQGGSSVLDVALKYQYNTYESYSRAFKKLFGVSPQKYRENTEYIDIFPRVLLTCNYLSEDTMLINKEMNTENVIKKINYLSKGYILDIDIDNFEHFNKTYGYSIGDKVLIELPNKIKAILKSFKFPANIIRINNDEFVVIIKDQQKALIEKLAENIVNEVSKGFTFNELLIQLTVSIGISTFSIGRNNQEALKTANNTMLLAKSHGKNQYKILEES